MVALAVLCLIGLAFEELGWLANDQIGWLNVFEITVGLIFLGEFIFELYYAKNRKKYLRRHWFYLIASVPLPLQAFDLLRGLRVFRLIRLLQVYAHLRYEHNTRLFAVRRS